MRAKTSAVMRIDLEGGKGLWCAAWRRSMDSAKRSCRRMRRRPSGMGESIASN